MGTLDRKSQKSYIRLFCNPNMQFHKNKRQQISSSSVSEHSCEMISKLLKRRKTYFEFSTKNLIQRKVNKEFKLSVDLQRATFSWRSIKGLSC